MIFRASIGDLSALLDDEMTDERPTPEVAADYLTRCVQGVTALYEAMPDGVHIEGDATSD
jgi:hypothetical protein